MEIPNQPVQGPRPNRRSTNEQPIDITRLNREAIQRSTEEFEQAQYSTDRIELSQEGQALAANAAKDASQADEARSAEAAHQAKVQELRQKYVEGKLNTPERVDRAAHKILTRD
jgi:pyruvate/2-oxoglutarate dehydrogenase complex dihydrolipoamide acyltransferase (E2) component